MNEWIELLGMVLKLSAQASSIIHEILRTWKPGDPKDSIMIVYRLPEFNVFWAAWLDGGKPSERGPDVSHITGQLYLPSRGIVPTEISNPRRDQPSIQLRYPRDAGITKIDYVEAPEGSGVYYKVRFQHPMHLGFPNEYAVAWLELCNAEGDFVRYPGDSVPIPPDEISGYGGSQLEIWLIGHGTGEKTHVDPLEHAGSGEGEVVVSIAGEGVGTLGLSPGPWEFTAPGAFEWVCPAAVYFRFECFGSCGSGDFSDTSGIGAGGGGGGEYATSVVMGVVGRVYSIAVDAMDVEGLTEVRDVSGGDTPVCGAVGGQQASGATGGIGGTGGYGDTHFDGGEGGDSVVTDPLSGPSTYGGGGGQQASSGGAGTDGTDGTTFDQGVGGGTGGDGGMKDGASIPTGGNGVQGGGGGGGGEIGETYAGGDGTDGRIVITYY